MRTVIQRVREASVTMEGRCFSFIEKGLLVLISIEESDTKEDIEWLCKKIASLRVFDDDEGVMNLSVKDISGDLLVVSQFTLHASTKKGNRPSYIRAAAPEIAIPIYKKFIAELEVESGRPVHTGVFGANMQVALVNDGPVTIVIDTKHKDF